METLLTCVPLEKWCKKYGSSIFFATSVCAGLEIGGVRYRVGNRWSLLRDSNCTPVVYVCGWKILQQACLRRFTPFFSKPCLRYLWMVCGNRNKTFVFYARTLVPASCDLHRVKISVSSVFQDGLRDRSGVSNFSNGLSKYHRTSLYDHHQNTLKPRFMTTTKIHWNLAQTSSVFRWRNYYKTVTKVKP